MNSGELESLFLRFRSGGDVEALARVFDDTAPELIRMALHLVRRQEDAEDLLQQTFVTAIERARTFDPDGSLVSWLVGILAKHARNSWSKKKATPRSDLEVEEGRGLISEVLDREERVAIETALADLHEPYREVLVQLLVEGKRGPEIARGLRREPATIRSQIRRGIQLLRKALPKGLIAGGAVAFTESKGLAAIRAEVLAHAVKPSTVLIGIGGFVMGKKVVSGLVLATLIVATVVWDPITLRSGGEEPAVSLTGSGPDAAIRTEADLAGTAESVVEPGNVSAEALENRSEVDSAEPISVIPGAILVRGRVLGQGRRPVAGAALTVGFYSAEAREVVSGGNGVFLVHVPPPVRGIRLLLTVARQDGQVRSAQTVVKEGDVEFDVGAIVLMPAHKLRVRVTQDGVPVAAAKVTLDGSRRVVRLATAATDMHGHASFEAAPEQCLVVTAHKGGASGEVRAVPPGDQEVIIELSPDRDYEIHVTDAEDHMPIVGAAVVLVMNVWTPIDGSQMGVMGGGIAFLRDPSRKTLTDKNGVARILGIAAASLTSVEVEAEGYEEQNRSSPMVWLRDKPIVSIQLARSVVRTLRWPVEAGKIGRPPDGTKINVRFASGAVEPSEIHTAPTPAFMELGEVVLPGVRGKANFVGTTPDGAFARLFLLSDESEGEPIVFRRPRTIEVTVRDATGSLVEGARVVVRSGGIVLTTPATTDKNGIGVISGLYGGIRKVYVLAPGASGRGQMCGKVNLEQGDGRLDATLASQARIRVAFWLDGSRGLPSAYRFGPRGKYTVEGEDVEHAEVLVSTPVDAGVSGEIELSVSARRYLYQTVKVMLSAGQLEASVDVHLSSAGTLLVTVLHKPAKGVKLKLERHERLGGEFQRVNGSKLSVPNGPGGGFRFGHLKTGIYRVVDELSQRTSAQVQVVLGQPTTHVTLDVGNAQRRSPEK